MRRPDFWTIALPLGLVAVPALAAQSERDMSNDCFDVAAPMADVKVQGNVAGGVAAAPSVYQQMTRSGLRLGHQM